MISDFTSMMKFYISDHRMEFSVFPENLTIETFLISPVIYIQKSFFSDNDLFTVKNLWLEISPQSK